MAITTVSKLETLRFWCQKILPLVYDESLSYYETLCKIASYLNTQAEAVNTLNDNVVSLNNNVTTLASEIDSLEGRVEAVESEMTDFETSINAQFKELEDAINASVDGKLAEVDGKLVEVDVKIATIEAQVTAKLNSAISEMESIINDALVTLQQQFNTESKALHSYVENALAEFEKEIPDLQNVNVINPITKEREGIQDVIDAMMCSYRWGTLTAHEYEELNLTAEEYESAYNEAIPNGIHAMNYDILGRRYFQYFKDRRLYTHSIIDGSYIKVKNEVANMGKLINSTTCLTCSEFDSIKATVTAVEGSGASCAALDAASAVMLLPLYVS